MINESRKATKSARRRKQRKLLRKKQHQEQSAKQRPSCAELWSNTYHQLVQWQQQHLAKYYANVVGEAQQTAASYVPQIYESSSSEAEDNSEVAEYEPIDEGYLDFMATTLRHQQELRRKRAEAQSVSATDK